MPHVVVEGAGDLQILYQVFTPLIHEARISRIFLARSVKTLLDHYYRTECCVQLLFQLKLHEKLSLCVSCLPQINPQVKKWP